MTQFAFLFFFLFFPLDSRTLDGGGRERWGPKIGSAQAGNAVHRRDHPDPGGHQKCLHSNGSLAERTLRTMVGASLAGPCLLL